MEIVTADAADPVLYNTFEILVNSHMLGGSVASG